MRWTKGKPAAKAPTGVPLLVAFDPTPYEARNEGRKPWFATMKARNGWDRFARPCLQWDFYPSGSGSDLATPSRYWELPSE